MILCRDLCLWQIFAILSKIFSKKNILSQILFVLKNNSQKIPKNSPKIIIIIIPYNNKKRYLEFYIFKFWTSPNLTKYIYGLLPLEQHKKNWKTKTLVLGWLTIGTSFFKYLINLENKVRQFLINFFKISKPRNKHAKCTL
jgi:hypothetical protein